MLRTGSISNKAGSIPGYCSSTSNVHRQALNFRYMPPLLFVFLSEFFREEEV